MAAALATDSTVVPATADSSSSALPKETCGEWFISGFNRSINWLNKGTPREDSNSFVRSFAVDQDRDAWYAKTAKVAFALFSLYIIPLVFFAADWISEGLSKLASLCTKSKEADATSSGGSAPVKTDTTETDGKTQA